MRTVSCCALLAIASVAAADGEHGPMFGGSIVGSHSSEADLSGVGAELVLWYGRVGIAAEASRQWAVDDVHGPQVGTVTGSLRLLAFDHIVPSLLDAREVVELGIELQGIVERAWWTEAPGLEPVSVGFGIAVRLRGTSDDEDSNLLAESRLFLRVMQTRDTEMSGVAAREMSPSAERGATNVMFGLGALFGGGKPAYVARLRRNNALDSEWMVR